MEFVCHVHVRARAHNPRLAQPLVDAIHDADATQPYVHFACGSLGPSPASVMFEDKPKANRP